MSFMEAEQAHLTLLPTQYWTLQLAMGTGMPGSHLLSR